jgi:hypothetical protein
MVTIHGSNGIDLSHLVIFHEDHKIFVAGRERLTRRMRVFLVNQRTGEILSHNGRLDTWAVVEDEFSCRSISDNVADACERKHIPVYRVRGPFSG